MHELNLLPPSRRSSLRRESVLLSVNEFLNSIVLGLSLMTTVAVLLIVSLWLTILITPNSTKGQLNLVVAEYQKLREEIAEQNELLEKLSNIGQGRIVWSGILDKFFNVIPPGVIISRINGSVGEEQTVTLSFTGRAITRSTLTVFERRLRALDIVSNVESPTSNLLNRNNPRYQFNLTLKSNQ